MNEIIFLLALAVVWIIFATIEDLKKREIANWINFSLIVFALGFRFFYSLFSQDNFSFFYQGLVGFAIFFTLGNLFYYGKMFAGGDAKLMIAFGAVLPLYGSFLENIRFFLSFFMVFMFIGAFYGFTSITFLSLKNLKTFKKEFVKQFKKRKKIIYFSMPLALVLIVLGFFGNIFFVFGALVFIFPYFYLYAKSVEEACIVKEIKTNKLTEGDWLYNDVRVRGKIIKTNWEGLTKKEIEQIKKSHKVVKIKQGIPFSPVFLLSFLTIIVIYFLEINLWNPFW